MTHKETHPTPALWVGYRMLPKLAHMGFRQDLLPTLPGAERQKQACLRHASRMTAPEMDIYVKRVGVSARLRCRSLADPLVLFENVVDQPFAKIT